MDIRFAEKRLRNALLLVGPFTSLVISPWSSLDPISLVKLLTVSVFGFGSIFLIFRYWREFGTRIPRIVIALYALFAVWLFLSFLFSGGPLDQQFWGVFGRNNGLLGYLTLLCLLIGASAIRNDYHRKLIWSLILTAVPMTLYALVQKVGRDPIKWSEFQVFGTLGNINFLSAFFGMTSVAIFALVLSSSISLTNKILLTILALIDLALVVDTGSIQGFMIFLAGSSIVIYLKLRALEVHRNFKVLYLLFIALAGLIGIIGLTGRGPLAQFLFQPSVVFRADYMHAGWQMTINRPIFGVGLDGYGDFYREVRGEISTNRTGPDRIANTAHNIFLDISASGGFVLGLAYVGLLLIAVIRTFRLLKNSDRRYDYILTALFSTWVAYQIQALVSINQIGVGVWGWLLTGALIGYEPPTVQNSIPKGKSREPERIKSKTSITGRATPWSVSLVWWAGCLAGFLFAYPAYKADTDYKRASMTGSVLEMRTNSEKFGATAWHRELALDYAIRSNEASQVREIALGLVARYPRDFFGWRTLSYLTLSTPEERKSAFSKIKVLDPYNEELLPPS